MNSAPYYVYVGRTTERLETKGMLRELFKQVPIKNNETTVIMHLMQSDYLINTNAGFHFVYTVRRRLGKDI